MAGRHAAKPASERTLALTILAVGTLAAVASLFGGIWVVRAGVVVAIAMAVAAVLVAWRELSRERAAFQSEIKRQIGLRIAQADRHHADAVAMINRFNARTENLNGVVGTLRRQLAAARAELSSMRGNSAWLRGEVAERQARIDALEARVAELEAQHQGNVVELPRHATLTPTVDDIWGADEHPTMVDLAKLQLDVALPERRMHA